MPELPEVETIRRQMQTAVTGKKIVRVEVRFGKRLRPGKKEFAKIITGSELMSVGRRAKLLLLNLSNGWTIVTHLKMTGKYLIKNNSAKPDKHTHVVFHLGDGRQLFFHDIRKFGYLRLSRTSDLEEKVFAREGYGPEPLGPSFSYKIFTACLKKRGKKKIKPLLMEQTCIAGIGNIYADEALWQAKINPKQLVGTLSAANLKSLYRSIPAVLKLAIKHRGTSADNYLDFHGEAGENQAFLKVYGRDGEPCRRCKTAIVKIKLGSRSAHFCPKCQK
ncbi:MAG: DNA-formamidopyrimidine glycosylase [bacterium]